MPRPWNTESFIDFTFVSKYSLNVLYVATIYSKTKLLAVFIRSHHSSSCSWKFRRVSCSLILKCSWSLHLFLGRPTFLRPFGLYCSVCFGSLFVSTLCTCFSHFFWYCFSSSDLFLRFCASSTRIGVLSEPFFKLAFHCFHVTHEFRTDVFRAIPKSEMRVLFFLTLWLTTTIYY